MSVLQRWKWINSCLPWDHYTITCHLPGLELESGILPIQTGSNLILLTTCKNISSADLAEQDVVSCENEQSLEKQLLVNRGNRQKIGELRGCRLSAVMMPCKLSRNRRLARHYNEMSVGVLMSGDLVVFYWWMDDRRGLGLWKFCFWFWSRRRSEKSQTWPIISLSVWWKFTYCQYRCPVFFRLGLDL